MRKERRKAEKLYRSSKLESHKQRYAELRKSAIRVAKDKKLSYVSQKVSQGNTKTLYTTVNRLIDNTKESVLPMADSDEELANKFLHYFKEKIEKIRSKFPVGQSDVEAERPHNPDIIPLSSFSLSNEEELRAIIKKFGMKCSPEDPLPPAIMSAYLDTLLPVWVEIVNLSLSVGSMASLKSAVILPLIKELTSTTDIDQLKNYRPVSNLLFIS